MTTNDAAERLLAILTGEARYDRDDTPVEVLLDEALAAERRATVERITAKVNLLGRARRGTIYAIEQLDVLAILDAEADR